MENLPFLKIEKETISEEELLESAPKLFQPIGPEKINADGTIEIENEKLKIVIKYEEPRFSTDEISKIDEKLSTSSLRVKGQSIIEFLDFKPELFYKLTELSIENKVDKNKVSLADEIADSNVYVLKGGVDCSGSIHDAFSSCIKVNAEPKTAIALLTLFHEIGHKKNPNNNILEKFDIFSGDEKNSLSNLFIGAERSAWAYCLAKLKPFLKEMNISSEDLDAVIHKRALGTYSDFLSKN